MEPTPPIRTPADSCSSPYRSIDCSARAAVCRIAFSNIAIVAPVGSLCFTIVTAQSISSRGATRGETRISGPNAQSNEGCDCVPEGEQSYRSSPGKQGSHKAARIRVI